MGYFVPDFNIQGASRKKRYRYLRIRMLFFIPALWERDFFCDRAALCKKIPCNRNFSKGRFTKTILHAGNTHVSNQSGTGVPFFQPPVPVPHLVPAAFQFPKLAAPHPSLHVAFIQLARLRTGIFPQSFVKLGPRHQCAGCTAPAHQVQVKFLQPVVILHHLVIFQSGVLVTLLPVLRPRIDQTVIQRTGNRRGRRGCQPSGG